MKYEKGFKFMDYFIDFEVIEFMEQHNMYRLNNIQENRQNELLYESDIDTCIIMKDEFITKRESNRIFREKQDSREKAKNEKKELQEKDFNFCYGYVDNKTDLQRGKILKILNVRQYYNNEVITRKNLIERLIQNNDVTLKVYNNTNRYSDHKICLTYKKLSDKIEYRIMYNDFMLEVTKTEYDYTNYLLSNDLIKRIA